MKSPGSKIILVGAVFTTVFFLSAKPNLGVIFSSPLLSLSQYLALLGTFLFCFTYILTTRWNMVEKLFGGLDKVYRVHHMVSGIAFVMLLYHPLLLALKALPDVNFALRYLIPTNNYTNNAGLFALSLMIALLVLTIFVNLPYHIWLKTHQFFSVVLFSAAIHIFLISSDISRSLPLRIWMFFWLAVALFSIFDNLFLSKLYRPFLKYKIARVTLLADLVEIILEPMGKVLKYKPGQFAYLSIANHPGITSEVHPYSIASHPSANYLRFAIKTLGDHTETLHLLREGDIVLVRGSFGLFGSRIYTKKPVVLIGAGIGITPILSLVPEALARRSTQTSVIYLTKSKAEAVYDTELSSYKYPEFFKYHLHRSADQGRLCLDHLKALGIDLHQSLYFICGPIALSRSLEDQLNKIGVKSQNIIYEDFSFK